MYRNSCRRSICATADAGRNKKLIPSYCVNGPTRRQEPGDLDQIVGLDRPGIALLDFFRLTRRVLAKLPSTAALH